MKTLNDYSDARILNQILTLYYIEGRNQAAIAKQLNLSTAKVNRLIRHARDQGLVEINIRTPFQNLFELENQLVDASGIPEAIVISTLSEDTETVMQTVGRTAAEFLINQLRDGDTICIGGGKALYSIVQSIETRRKFDVRVVPATGGVQGRHYTDVNYLAARLADRLGGKAYQLHAPLFADTTKERNTLLKMRQTKEILDMARNAQIALHGIGAVVASSSSYFEMRYNSPSEVVRKKIIDKEKARGDIFANLYNLDGEICAPSYNDKVVGLTLEELHKIPLNIGVAATEDKVLPVFGALKGNLLKTLITDEITANGVLEMFKGEGKTKKRIKAIQ